MLIKLYPLQNETDMLQAFKSGAMFYDLEGEIFTVQDVDRIAASGYDGLLFSDGPRVEWLPL